MTYEGGVENRKSIGSRPPHYSEVVCTSCMLFTIIRHLTCTFLSLAHSQGVCRYNGLFSITSGRSSTESFPSKMPVKECQQTFLTILDWSSLLTISSGKQRELIELSPLFQKFVYLLGRRRSLQHLPIHFLLLNLLDADPPFHAHLRAPEVPTAATTRNQIRNTRTLFRKCGRTHGILKEHFPKLPHFEKSYTHDCCLGVVAPFLTDNEAGGEGDDVFESTTEGYACKMAVSAA